LRDVLTLVGAPAVGVPAVAAPADDSDTKDDVDDVAAAVASSGSSLRAGESRQEEDPPPHRLCPRGCLNCVVGVMVRPGKGGGLCKLKSEVNTAQTAHVITPSSSSSSSSPLPLPALPQRPLCSHALIECTSDACLQGGWGWRLAPCCLRSQTLPCIARLEQAFASLRSGWVWPHLHLLVARTTCRAEVPGVAYKRPQGGAAHTSSGL
jgi:hypothetical protein